MACMCLGRKCAARMHGMPRHNEAVSRLSFSSCNELLQVSSTQFKIQMAINLNRITLACSIYLHIMLPVPKYLYYDFFIQAPLLAACRLRRALHGGQPAHPKGQPLPPVPE